jgi:hypothetical protein
MKNDRPQLPPFDVSVDAAAPRGAVLRPLAALLLQVARRRLAGQKQPQAENVPNRDRRGAGHDT